MKQRREASSGRALPSRRALIVTDALALSAFVLTGAVSHHDAGMTAVVARNLVPLGAAWAVAGIVFGTYRRRSWAALILTWAVAAPAGILVRSWVAGSPRGVGLATFLLVGSGFSLLYLVVGRGLLKAAERFRAREVQA